MKLAKTPFLLFAIAIPNFTLAGAWGVGSFENDSALDWVYSLETSKTNGVVENALSATAQNGYIELDTCSAGLAAADIVGSVNIGSVKHLPPEVRSWISRTSFSPNDSLISDAVAAIDACTDGNESELAQLWEESAPAEWSSYVSELKEKLK